LIIIEFLPDTQEVDGSSPLPLIVFALLSDDDNGFFDWEKAILFPV